MAIYLIACQVRWLPYSLSNWRFSFLLSCLISCVGVVWFVFHVLQLPPIRFTQKRNLCCISRSTMKHLESLDWKSDVLKVHVWWFLNWIHRSSQLCSLMSWHKHKAQKEAFFLWLVIRKAVAMNGMDESRQRLIRVAFIVARNLWSQCNIDFTFAHWLNKCDAMWLTSFANSLPKEVILALVVLFRLCNAILINNLANH